MGHHTGALIQTIKQFSQDFEFYPTTNEQLEVIKADLEVIFRSTKSPSILDIGAGNGKALKHLTEGKKYAIEKSLPLLNALDSDIFVVGTDFKEQTIIDKRCDLVFCNPPYSEFAYFARRIIEEANARYIYLVLPERWEKNDDIQSAIKARDASYTVLGSYDYLNAERKARAKVHVVRIDLCYCRDTYYSGATPKVDPFSLWFAQNFNIFNEDEKPKATDTFNKDKAHGFSERVSNSLVPGVDLVSTLEALYNDDLNKLIETYKKLESIDNVVLKELGANFDGVKEALKLKIEGLKDKYWRELFSNLDKVTNRLTAKSREKLLKVLFENTHVDFTKTNAYALVQWVCKNANNYFDEQLVDVVECMIGQANVILYKSNEKTFGKEEWRYIRWAPEGLDRFSLDYRIVVHREGGRSDSWDSSSGLSKRAHTYLNDLCTIASNVGFDTSGCERADSFDWTDSGKKVFNYYDHTTQKNVTLFESRAYYNGNIHLRLNQAFIAKLNVLFGKLKGWVRSPREAAEEMGIDIDLAQESFGANFKITSPSDVLRLELN
jgi:hypothetical protein